MKRNFEVVHSEMSQTFPEEKKNDWDKLAVRYFCKSETAGNDMSPTTTNTFLNKQGASLKIIGSWQ